MLTKGFGTFALAASRWAFSFSGSQQNPSASCAASPFQGSVPDHQVTEICSKTVARKTAVDHETMESSSTVVVCIAPKMEEHYEDYRFPSDRFVGPFRLAASASAFDTKGLLHDLDRCSGATAN